MLAGAGLITISFLCIQFVIAVFMNLFGLTPEQRAASQNRRMVRDTERAARAAERESRLQHQLWREEVAQQRLKGKARFAEEAEAHAGIQGKGGRISKLDDRWFG
jgi:hypothetical protein